MDDKKFYGIYSGICVDNRDPQNRYRIRLKVHQVLGNVTTNWAEACVPITSTEEHGAGGTEAWVDTTVVADHYHQAKNRIHKKIPDLGQVVWVMFIGGDPNFPVWIGVGV